MSRSQQNCCKLNRDEMRLWYASQLREGATSYNIPFHISFPFDIDLAAFKSAFAFVQERHEALRMRIDDTGSFPVKVVHDRPAAALEVIDLTAGPRPETQLDALRQEIAQNVFDLAKGPMCRAALMKLSENAWEFVFCAHHIAFDGQSKEILINDLADGYAAFAVGDDPRPSPQAVPQTRIEMQNDSEDLEYWRNKLKGAPQFLALPVSLTRSSSVNYKGLYMN